MIFSFRCYICGYPDAGREELSRLPVTFPECQEALSILHLRCGTGRKLKVPLRLRRLCIEQKTKGF